MSRGARIAPREFLELPLEVHAILEGIPLQDVSAIDLPGGGESRTIGEVRALLAASELTDSNPLVNALFGLRRALGALFGWDSESGRGRGESYVHRIPRELHTRSNVEPGTPDGPFTVVYQLERETLSEIRNATVHAFLCAALQRRGDGYRLYWAVYVEPVSWFTPLYMTTIEPFRRFVVYPALLRRVRRAWVAAYSSG